jgi:hypothetical protein
MKAKQSDPQVGDSDIRELLVGTWLAIGIVADALAESGKLDRGQLFTRLVAAEAETQKLGGERYIAFAAVRWIFESLTEAKQTPVHSIGQVIRFPRRNSRGGKSSIGKRGPA